MKSRADFKTQEEYENYLNGRTKGEEGLARLALKFWNDRKQTAKSV